ncbi:transposable element Tcb2 transposase [Trichonephila clavipes]|nr:transposable element Tcb2 transposase [Trichonephila clavipes]
METGWRAKRVDCQLDHSYCVVRRCWDQWIREMSFSRRPGEGYPGQNSRQEDHHIVRNARLQPTASSATIQPQVAPSLGAPVSSQTIRRHLAEEHLRCESRFNISSDDNRVWRPHGERINTALALQRHNTPTAGMMIRVAIAYNKRSPVVLIRGTLTAQ